VIGQRLKILRKDKKISQKDLAVILGVQESVISHYETNRSDPGDEIKVEIAKYFGVSLDYLLGVIEKKVPFFSDERFLLLPDDLTSSDRSMLRQFIKFLKFTKINPKG